MIFNLLNIGLIIKILKISHDIVWLVGITTFVGRLTPISPFNKEELGNGFMGKGREFFSFFKKHSRSVCAWKYLRGWKNGKKTKGTKVNVFFQILQITDVIFFDTFKCFGQYFGCGFELSFSIFKHTILGLAFTTTKGVHVH